MRRGVVRGDRYSVESCDVPYQADQASAVTPAATRPAGVSSRYLAFGPIGPTARDPFDHDRVDHRRDVEAIRPVFACEGHTLPERVAGAGRHHPRRARCELVDDLLHPSEGMAQVEDDVVHAQLAQRGQEFTQAVAVERVAQKDGRRRRAQLIDAIGEAGIGRRGLRTGP